MNLAVLRRQRKSWLIIAGLIVGALALRLFRLGCQSLWTDEVVTYLAARQSVWMIITRPYDPAFSFYNLVVHTVLPFGAQDWLVRLPSVFFGVLGVPLFFLIARKWFDKTTSLVATSLMVV